jgi:hypothetical protein
MELKKTISTIFMLPTLKIPRERLTENGFINSYEYDEGHDVQYPNCVYLLFKPTDFRTFRAFLDEEYERTTNIIEDYDYGKGFVVVVYKLDTKYINDFNLIRKGKYSKTSKAFQSIYNKTIKIFRAGVVSEEVSLQFRIFNKTKDLVDFWEDKMGIRLSADQEVWQAYEKEREVLNTVKLETFV